MAQLTESQQDVLAYTVLGEAAGEGYDGMAAVAHVIKNRAESGGQFPSDPAKVAKQNKQFSTWNEGQGGNNPTARYSRDSAIFQLAKDAVNAAFDGRYPDPTGGAVQYWSPAGMRAMGKGDPSWAAAETTKFGRVQIGGHVFLARQEPARVPPGSVASSVGSATSVSRSISGFPTPLPRNPANPPLPVKRPSQAVTTLPPAKLPSLPPGGPVTSQTRQEQRADNNQTKPFVLTRQTAAMTQAQAQAATGFRLPTPATGNTMTRKQQLADNGQTRPKTVTKQVQVPNPAYQALMQQAAAGAKVGVTPSGMPLSRDGFARYEASKKALEAKLAATPKTITVTRTVRQPVAVKPPAKAAPVLRPAPRPSPPPINSANHNSAQLKAVAEGRSTYSVEGAPSRSVYAMNGKLRNTYGDDPRTASGGSLIG